MLSPTLACFGLIAEVPSDGGADASDHQWIDSSDSPTEGLDGASDAAKTPDVVGPMDSMVGQDVIDASLGDAHVADAAIADTSVADSAITDAGLGPEVSCTPDFMYPVNSIRVADSGGALVTSYDYGGLTQIYNCRQWVCPDGTQVTVTGQKPYQVQVFVSQLSPSDVAALKASVALVASTDAGSTTTSKLSNMTYKVWETQVFGPNEFSMDVRTDGVNHVETSDNDDAATGVRPYACVPWW